MRVSAARPLDVRKGFAFPAENLLSLSGLRPKLGPSFKRVFEVVDGKS